MKAITDAKELITSVMEEIRKQKEEDSPRRHGGHGEMGS
jgi:hypothetical protein